MPEVLTQSAASLRAGDRLAQDVMSGNTVWLRSGTVLQDAHIERLRRMGLSRIAVHAGNPEPPPDDPQVAALQPPAPDFASLASDDRPRWMSDASFAQNVVLPAPLTPEEQQFAEQKLNLRLTAGLKPLVDPGLEAELNKSLQTAFISAASTGRLDLRRIGQVAELLTHSLPDNREDYFIFTDIARYGQHLSARGIMSSKIYAYTRPGGGNGIEQLMRAHLALQNMFALLPVELSKPIEAQTPDERMQFRTASIQFFNWLKAQDFVEDAALEEVLQQFERFDGTGAPFGLGGERVSDAGQTWALALAYSERVFSRPKRYRLSPHQAADELVRQSGSAFASGAVNRFLKLIGFFPNGSLVELSDGRLALVLRQSERGLLKPVVRTTTGTLEEIDLKASPSVFIRRPILEY